MQNKTKPKKICTSQFLKSIFETFYFCIICQFLIWIMGFSMQYFHHQQYVNKCGVNFLPKKLCVVSGGKSVAGRKHEHQNRRLWLQQLLLSDRAAGHVVRLSSLRRARGLRGQKVHGAWNWYLGESSLLPVSILCGDQTVSNIHRLCTQNSSFRVDWFCCRAWELFCTCWCAGRCLSMAPPCSRSGTEYFREGSGFLTSWVQVRKISTKLIARLHI